MGISSSVAPGSARTKRRPRVRAMGMASSAFCSAWVDGVGCVVGSVMACLLRGGGSGAAHARPGRGGVFGGGRRGAGWGRGVRFGGGGVFKKKKEKQG